MVHGITLTVMAGWQQEMIEVGGLRYIWILPTVVWYLAEQ